MIWLWVGVGMIGLFVLIRAFTSQRDAALRQSGNLPPPGKATMADVQRLIQSDQKITAIKCYREIHQVGLAEAKNAVEALAREIKSKENR